MSLPSQNVSSRNFPRLNFSLQSVRDHVASHRVFGFRSVVVWLAAIAVAGMLTGSLRAKGPAVTDPAKADADFAFQGEYVGEAGKEDKMRYGAQIIALGGGKFHAVGYVGGLPGDGWNGTPKIELDGQMENGAVVFKGDTGHASIKNGVLTVSTGDGEAVGKLNKVERKSPTLGAKPPAGAVVQFDGKSVEGWKDGKLDEGLLCQGTTSKETFGSHTLHIEFRLPYQPEERGQGRGNSGLYLQGRYEVQMLDSFGLKGEDNECGGIYSVKKPDVNMCLPPLAWQTYDVEFTAAKYDDAGKVVSPPRVTVSHNGVVIHKDVVLPADRNTTAAPLGPGREPGPVYLQDHGNPVRYRNVWVVKKS